MGEREGRILPSEKTKTAIDFLFICRCNKYIFKYVLVIGLTYALVVLKEVIKLVGVFQKRYYSFKGKFEVAVFFH